MKAWSWAVVAALGFGVMLWAYLTRARLDSGAPWVHGVMIIGPDETAEKDLPVPSLRARVRLLEASGGAEFVIRAMAQAGRGRALDLETQLRPELLLLGPAEAGISAEWLQSGRLPEPGGDEVLAGSKLAQVREITVRDRTLNVVGVLKPDVALFAKSYLIPPSESASNLAAPGDDAVHQATLVRLSAPQSRDRQLLHELEQAFPGPKYVMGVPSVRVDSRTFYLYLAGQAVLLVAGSGALIGFYRWVAGRVRPSEATTRNGSDLAELTPKMTPSTQSFLAAPLEAMRERPRLLWGVHLGYFGLVMLSSVLIYNLPDVQNMLVAMMRGALRSPSSPLSVAAKAYESGNVLRAAAVTFAVNFFLGSLAYLTLPSMVLPGAGIFLAALRAFVWGLLLAPTFEDMATGMLPHSGTMLLEGEGYILAAFFGLLIPVHILQSSLGGTAGSRYGRVLLLNLKACVLVALVLAVAALYESFEVIAMMR
jgi:hypothetical protein